MSYIAAGRKRRLERDRLWLHANQLTVQTGPGFAFPALGFWCAVDGSPAVRDDTKGTSAGSVGSDSRHRCDRGGSHDQPRMFVSVTQLSAPLLRPSGLPGSGPLLALCSAEAVNKARRALAAVGKARADTVGCGMQSLAAHIAAADTPLNER